MTETSAPHAAPAPFNTNTVRRHRERALGTLAQADFLAARIAEDFIERLDSVNRRFDRALVLGPPSPLHALLRARIGQEGLVVSADWASGDAFCDPERLPFGDESFDLVVSSMALHWVNDLPGALVQIRRALKPDGLFLGAFPGGRTLHELRGALLGAELEVRGGASMRVSPFADLQDVAGLLQRAGFALPVTDRDTLTVRYLHPLQLLRDLRLMGETGCPSEVAPPLTRAILARTCAIYERDHVHDDRIPATFEIITATGWRPHPSQQKPLRPGSATARLSDALESIERQRAQTGADHSPRPEPPETA